MPLAGDLELAGGGEQVQREPAHRLEHPVARAPRRAPRNRHERLVDESPERAERDPRGTCGRLSVEAGDEDPQLAEPVLFVWFEQLVTPLHSRADSAVTRRRQPAPTAGDLTEVRAQLHEQLGRSHHRHASGRQLYREREVIDARADSCDRSLRFGIGDEARVVLPRSLHEQPARV